jgi:hypothetical protein
MQRAVLHLINPRLDGRTVAFEFRFTEDGTGRVRQNIQVLSLEEVELYQEGREYIIDLSLGVTF